MKQQPYTLEEQLQAAQKTIAVLMERTEHAIDMAGSLHNLFEDNFLLRQQIKVHLKTEEELRQFNLALEHMVDLKTRELQEANQELNEINRHLSELVRRDGLTGLYNHTAMSEMIRQKVAEAARYQNTLALVFLDIDHFKRVNDIHGHPFGDHVLAKVAGVLSESIRVVDYASRFGGEEFALLLVNTTITGAMTISERIRKNIEALKWPEKPGFSITISAGVANYANDAAESLISRADRCLYQAKEAGRNQVVVDDRVRLETSAS